MLKISIRWHGSHPVTISWRRCGVSGSIDSVRALCNQLYNFVLEVRANCKCNFFYCAVLQKLVFRKLDFEYQWLSYRFINILHVPSYNNLSLQRDDTYRCTSLLVTFSAYRYSASSTLRPRSIGSLTGTTSISAVTEWKPWGVSSSHSIIPRELIVTSPNFNLFLDSIKSIFFFPISGRIWLICLLPIMENGTPTSIQIK